MSTAMLFSDLLDRNPQFLGRPEFQTLLQYAAKRTWRVCPNDYPEGMWNDAFVFEDDSLLILNNNREEGDPIAEAYAYDTCAPTWE